MRSSDYEHSGRRIINLGYCMDFTLKGIMKIMWLGRKEIKFDDFKWLISFWANRKGPKYTPTPSQKIATDGI